MSWLQSSMMQTPQNQPNAPMPDGPSEAEIAALKCLSSFVISDDDDAGNVIEVINSLTQTYLQYKTRTLSIPVRELLIKSLKSGNEGLECILKHHGVENMKPLEKFSDINNTTTRCASNVLRQFSSKWKEDVEAPASEKKTDRSFDEVSYSNRGRDTIMQENKMTSMTSARSGHEPSLNQPSHGWKDTSPRSGTSGSFSNAAGSAGSSSFNRGNDTSSIVDLFKTYRSHSKF